MAEIIIFCTYIYTKHLHIYTKHLHKRTHTRIHIYMYVVGKSIISSHTQVVTCVTDGFIRFYSFFFFLFPLSLSISLYPH